MESRGQRRLVPGGRNEKVWLEGDEDNKCQDGLEAISIFKIRSDPTSTGTRCLLYCFPCMLGVSTHIAVGMDNDLRDQT